MSYQFPWVGVVVAMLTAYAALGVVLKFLFFSNEEPNPATTVTFEFWQVWRFIAFLWGLPHHLRSLAKSGQSEQDL